MGPRLLTEAAAAEDLLKQFAVELLKQVSPLGVVLIGEIPVEQDLPVSRRFGGLEQGSEDGHEPLGLCGIHIKLERFHVFERQGTAAGELGPNPLGPIRATQRLIGLSWLRLRWFRSSLAVARNPSAGLRQ